MSRRNFVWASAAMITLGALAGSMTGQVHAADKASIAGHYYLRGVREVGSELLLRPDGKFQWSMSYGAVDQYAQGVWSFADDTVVLEATKPIGSPRFRLFTKDELNIRKPAVSGTWVAIVGLPRVGPATGMEVVFESKTGKRATAVTNPAGDAVVTMDDSEVWNRAGLRRKGDSSELQWFDIPADRVADHIACFAVDDEKWVVPQAFDFLRLKRKNKMLVSEDGRMKYSRE